MEQEGKSMFPTEMRERFRFIVYIIDRNCGVIMLSWSLQKVTMFNK